MDHTQGIPVTAGQQNVNVILEPELNLMETIVVSDGYGSMKKSDMSGASSTITESAIRSSVPTNIDQALQGRASGITSVMTSGAPGSAVSIRIRGQATLHSSAEPIYVVDGVIWRGGETNPLQLGLGLGNGRGAVSPLSTLNPSDITSMEVLKDASATAIYGAQGANGVVLITTKHGQSGEAKFTYEGMFGIQNQVSRLDMMDLREYARFNSMIEATTGGSIGTPEYMDPSILGKGTDWQEAIFRTALMHQHTLSAAGGSEKVRYYVSGSLMDQQGTMIGTDFNRFSVRANLDADLKKWLKLGVNAMYSRTSEFMTRAEGDEGVLTYSLQGPPDIPVYDAYGNFASVIKEDYTRVNPIALSSLNEDNLQRQKLNGNIYLDFKPLKGLTLHSELGFDIGISNSESWRPTYDFGPTTQNPIASIQQQVNQDLYWQVKNYLTYEREIGKHSFSAMVGQEAWESSWKFQRIIAANLPGNEIRNPGLAEATGDDDNKNFANGYGDGAMASFFTRESYNYDDRYMFTYTFRYDGSSNFGPKNRWAPFHSVAVSWNFSNEAFFEPVKHIISYGKLRVGWGQTGNAGNRGGRWNSTIEPFPTGLGTANRMSAFANSHIQWEPQEQWNLGLDLSFLNNSINLTLDLYDKSSYRMLMELQTPTYFGGRGNGSSVMAPPWGNFGAIQNRGMEITLNTRNIENANFSWSTDFTISFNKNKLLALMGTDASAIEGYGQWDDVVSLSRIGGPLYDFYGFKTDGVYTSRKDIEEHRWAEEDYQSKYYPGFNRYNTWFVGDIKYRDLSGPEGVPDGRIDDHDKTNIGSPLPLFTFGFNNTFTYKNFDLSIFINGSYGNKIFNELDRKLTSMEWNSNQLRKASGFANMVPIDPNKSYPITYEYYVKQPNNEPDKVQTVTINNWFEDINNVMLSNPNTKMSRGGRGLPKNNSETSDRYIEDGSYLRIKNIMIGYTFPKRWISKARIESLRIYANIQNLYTFTKYTGYDPEVGINPQDSSGFTFGYDAGRYPAPRLISFGLNISF